MHLSCTHVPPYQNPTPSEQHLNSLFPNIRPSSNPPLPLNGIYAFASQTYLIYLDLDVSHRNQICRGCWFCCWFCEIPPGPKHTIPCRTNFAFKFYKNYLKKGSEDMKHVGHLQLPTIWTTFWWIWLNSRLQGRAHHLDRQTPTPTPPPPPSTPPQPTARTTMPSGARMLPQPRGPSRTNSSRRRRGRSWRKINATQQTNRYQLTGLQNQRYTVMLDASCVYLWVQSAVLAVPLSTDCKCSPKRSLRNHT